MAYKKYSSKTTAQDKYSDLAKSVADIFIKALEEETLPWQRGFNPIFKHPPFNPASGTIYRGSNRMLLSLVAYQNGFKDPRFMTYNQAVELGGHVRKGEKSITCIKYGERKKAALDEEGKPKFDEEGKPLYEVKGYLSTFNVFNVEQIDGLNLPPITKESDVAIHNWSPIERAENLLVATGAKIENTSDCTIPCYNPSMDLIKLPLKEQYENKERYYATALHELSHWTGHKSRLDRDLDNSFGTDNYAKEELRKNPLFACLGVLFEGIYVKRDETDITALKEALKGEDTADIKAKTESLQEIAMKLAQKVYENAAKEQQANSEETKTEETSKKDDDVEEANYEEK